MTNTLKLYYLYHPIHKMYLCAGGDGWTKHLEYAGSWSNKSQAKASLTRFKKRLAIGQYGHLAHLAAGPHEIIAGRIVLMTDKIELI